LFLLCSFLFNLCPSVSMSSPSDAYELIWPGKKRISLPTDAPPVSLRHTDAFDAPGGSEGFRNRLIRGDNRLAMEALLPEFRGRIDLIYVDPPFDAGQDFAAE